MLLTYTPDGAAEQQWTVKLDQLMSSEAEAIETVTGLTYDEFGVALLKGSRAARRALLWVYLKRSEPTLRHMQIDPPVGSLELKFEPDELREIRAAVEGDKDLSDEDRAAALDELDKQLLDAGEATPKAPTDNVVTPISAPSLTSYTSAPQTSTG